MSIRYVKTSKYWKLKMIVILIKYTLYVRIYMGMMFSLGLTKTARKLLMTSTLILRSMSFFYENDNTSL